MEQVADGLQRVSLMPGDRLNSYVIGGVLIDSGTPQSHKKLLPQLTGIEAHALTHGHDDHYGSSKTVRERLEIPFWVPDGDADEVAARKPVRPQTWFTPIMRLAKPAPAPPIARRLREGDEVGGFTVRDAPGHSPGHVVYWREADRTLVIGDVLFNCNLVTGAVGLREPPRIFTVDVARNRDSIRRVATLEPETVVFGHGPPLRGAAGPVAAFAAALPA